MAKFVGEEAYKQAGGTVTQDLFENEVLFNNPDILEGLFAQKLDDEATALQEAQGWAWMMTTEDSQPYWYEVQSEHSFARVYKIESVLTEEQQARKDDLDKLGWEADLSDADAAELAGLEAIVEGDYTAEQKQLAGVTVYVKHNGEIATIQGLVKKDDQAAAIDAGVLRSLQTQKPEFMVEIEAEVGADIRGIWTPTATNCFKRLNGASIGRSVYGIFRPKSRQRDIQSVCEF